jgi:hypothetical protein
MLLTSDAMQLLHLGSSSAVAERTGIRDKCRIARRSLAAEAYALYDEAGRLIGTILHSRCRPRVGHNAETVYVRRES